MRPLFVKIIATITLSFCLFIPILAQEWQAWNEVNCWPGLSYRFKKTNVMNGRTSWDIQFKNNYNQQISFNFNIINTDEAELAKTLVKQKRLKNINADNRHRWTELQGRGTGRIANLAAGAIESNFGSTTTSGVSLIVFEFKFGDDYTEKKYAGCGSNVNNEDFYLDAPAQNSTQATESGNDPQPIAEAKTQAMENASERSKENIQNNNSSYQSQQNSSTVQNKPPVNVSQINPAVNAYPQTNSAAVFSEQLDNLVKFINRQFLPQSGKQASWDGDWNKLTPDEIMYGSARMRQFYKTGEEESNFKEIRAQLYESIEYYTSWYADTITKLNTAKSAISWNTGEPDFVKYEKHEIRDKAKQLFESGEGYQLAQLLKPIFLSPMDMEVHRDYPDYKRHQFNFLEPLKYGKYEKATESETAKADKGKLEAILNMFFYYGNDENRDGNFNYKLGLEMFDKYYRQYISHPEIQNGKFNKSKIMTNWVILFWCETHFNKTKGNVNPERLREMLALVRHAQSLISIEQFKKGKENLFGDRFFHFYVIEQYFSTYFLGKSGEMRLLMTLYPHMSEEEKKKADSEIIQIYADVATTLKPIFNNPILNRPFTNDWDWNKNHGY